MSAPDHDAELVAQAIDTFIEIMESDPYFFHPANMTNEAWGKCKEMWREAAIEGTLRIERGDGETT